MSESLLGLIMKHEAMRLLSDSDCEFLKGGSSNTGEIVQANQRFFKEFFGAPAPVIVGGRAWGEFVSEYASQA